MEQDGNTYYLYGNGEMAENQWEKGENGDEWYYFSAGGAMKKGWINDNGDYYYLYDENILAKGWMQQGDKWYYLDNSGKMQSGWQNIDGEEYYFYSDGTMGRNWTKVGDDWYFFKKDGKMAVGWIYKGGGWYYCEHDGTMVAGGWVRCEDNTLYYFDDSGRMQRRRKELSDGTICDYAASGQYIGNNQHGDCESDHIPEVVAGVACLSIIKLGSAAYMADSVGEGVVAEGVVEKFAEKGEKLAEDATKAGEYASSAAQYQRLKGILAKEEIQSVIKTTEHGAERLMSRGFSPSEISNLKLSPDKIMTQLDGASVYIKNVSGGKFNLIVESENGVVTALKNISQKSLDRLANNYGWK